MKAVHVAEAGGTDQLIYGDWPDPQIGAGEVLVQVRAASVNNVDIMVRQGLLGRLPLVLGTDAAGTVAQVGAEARGLAMGDRVIVNGAISCDACDYCFAGNHGTCRQRAALGQAVDGTYAEYVKLPWRNVLPIAGSLSFEDAAAAPAVFFTAWQALMTRAGLRPGETVLVTAAGSGVGNAGIQLAKLAGALVIAGSTSDDTLADAKQWGAEATVNFAAGNWAQSVLDLTGGEGPHVIFDILGGAYWPEYLRCVRAGGRIVTCSVASGNKPDLDILALLARQVTILGTGGFGAKGDIARVVGLLNEGRIRSRVSRLFPLTEAAQAQDALRDRGTTGKIILTP
ncbi:alcohol dehydrogenase catalytic domain-containing protein [Sphingobium tyrosinilyticum]|uniref:Alcohol dehydrogenase catalytic domain-containing protein n=1 Tax=Sphingobium tyrosinilyticum TaxID=2715436 RepID=A0ABV9F3C0_9SPHN